jgi:hypothetical protein
VAVKQSLAIRVLENRLLMIISGAKRKEIIGAWEEIK